MYCVKCGKELREGAAFCTACGAEQKRRDPEGGALNRPKADGKAEVYRPSAGKKKGNGPLIAAVIALTLVLAAIVVLIFFLPSSGKKGGENDKDELIADSGDDEERKKNIDQRQLKHSRPPFFMGSFYTFIIEEFHIYTSVFLTNSLPFCIMIFN